MRKLHTFWLAFAAALTFSALASALASAEETLLAEWLINGVAVTAAKATILEGEFIFGAEKGTLVKCSYKLIGLVNTNGKGEETEILNLSGVKVTEAAPLLCLALNVCEVDETDVEVFPRKLPWQTLAFLMEGGTYLELVEKETWEIKCLALMLKITNECEFPDTTYEILNTVGGTEYMGLGTPLGNCSVGGMGVGEMEMVPANLDTGAGTLSISSE